MPQNDSVVGLPKLQVLDLPDTKPVLEYNRDTQTGIHSSSNKGYGNGVKTAASLGYRVGDILDVNCTSPKSKPPATLKWYINNEMVRPG